MQQRWIIWLVLVLAAACSKQKPVVKDNSLVIQPIPEPRYILPQDALAFTPKADTIEQPWLKDHFFGKFFQDRAEFFVIQNSTSTIFDTPVKTIVLYYLDEQHCQSKFIVTENMADKLIARYGTFSMTALDAYNRELAGKEKILIVENGSKKLNRAFTHVELSWKLNDKIVRFRVNEQHKTEPFVYIEHVPEYQNLYRTVEMASL
jgi:hypothetical protein